MTGGSSKLDSHGLDSLDTTEMYDPSIGSWKMIDGKLQTPRTLLRMITLDKMVLAFGKILAV